MLINIKRQNTFLWLKINVVYATDDEENLMKDLRMWSFILLLLNDF